MTRVPESGRVLLRFFERGDAETYRRWRGDADVARLASLGRPVGRRRRGISRSATVEVE